MSGCGTILQFKVNLKRERLNPMVKKPLDCGANALYLLGILNLSDALDLSDLQNSCAVAVDDDDVDFEPLSYKFVFNHLITDKNNNYVLFKCYQDELIEEAVKQFDVGCGTIIYMSRGDQKYGHYVCIYKSETGIKIADLQKRTIEPHELTEYLRQYETFLIPTVEPKKGGRRRRKTRKN